MNFSSVIPFFPIIIIIIIVVWTDGGRRKENVDDGVTVLPQQFYLNCWYPAHTFWSCGKRRETMW